MFVRIQLNTMKWCIAQIDEPHYGSYLFVNSLGLISGSVDVIGAAGSAFQARPAGRALPASRATSTELDPAGQNIKQFSETIKTQPWRLIWPSTKNYAEASPSPAPGQGTITVRKTARARARPSATPTSRTSSR